MIDSPDRRLDVGHRKLKANDTSRRTRSEADIEVVMIIMHPVSKSYRARRECIIIATPCRSCSSFHLLEIIPEHGCGVSTQACIRLDVENVIQRPICMSYRMRPVCSIGPPDLILSANFQ